MTEKQPASTTSVAPDVDLKNPGLAAFLAWLVPGLGHIYQGRTAKGLLFMVCILGTFVHGLYLGGGRVVYANWEPDDRRWPYLCQVGVGLPALPALVQTARVREGKTPLFGGLMAPPKAHAGFHAGDDEIGGEELDELHYRLHRFFELGTVFTMIAGLLNILAIYDAWGGPVLFETGPPRPRSRSEDEIPPPGGGASPPKKLEASG